MSTSNRERAARGGWGLGAVSNFNALPSNRSLMDHALATDEQIAASVAEKFGPAWTTRGATVVKREESANPTPAPSQVWVPPDGEPRPGWVDVDGTVTFAENHETPRDGRLCLTRGGTMDARDLDGWRCVGVATPHGRVMVGDGWQRGGGSDFTVTAIATSGGEPWIKVRHASWMQDLDFDARNLWACEGYKRTRYAPARVGERYLHRSRRFLVTIPATPSIFSTGPTTWGDEVRVHLSVGVSMPVDEWERLEPSTASHAVGTVPRVPESDADLRARIVKTHPVGAHSVALLIKVAGEIAATLPVMFENVLRHLSWVLASPASGWADIAARGGVGCDCNPLTASGAALDRLAPLWGIERRGGTVASHGGLAEAIALANGIRDALRLTPGIGTIPAAPRACRPGLYNIADASLAFTRIHDAAAPLYGTRLANPGGIPTASPEPTAEERAATAIADRRALDLGVPRREGEPLAAFTRRCNAVEVRRAVDRCVTADHGPFATARAAALHAWAETLYSHDTVADAAAVHAGLLRYEALRGSRREPSLAAMDVGVPETARAMYERERGGKRVEAVTPPEEPARPTGGATLNGWQTAAHFWERWSR